MEVERGVCVPLLPQAPRRPDYTRETLHKGRIWLVFITFATDGAVLGRHEVCGVLLSGQAPHLPYSYRMELNVTSAVARI